MSDKVDILGVQVDSVTMAQAVAQVESYMDEKKNVLIATANAEMIMRATHDSELKEILNAAALVVPDHGSAAINEDAVKTSSGALLRVQELMRIAPSKKQKVFFFGSAPGVAEKAKAKAEELYPGIEIVGTRDGYFKPEDEPAIIAEIKAAQPDLLLAALGVPKQEKWLNAHLQELGVPVSIGVGGTLDVMAGVMKRAPYWMQKAKLEWLFRGLLQPKRAGRLLALPKFVLKVHGSKSRRA